jgi:hypothetical protein
MVATQQQRLGSKTKQGTASMSAGNAQTCSACLTLSAAAAAINPPPPHQLVAAAVSVAARSAAHTTLQTQDTAAAQLPTWLY